MEFGKCVRLPSTKFRIPAPRKNYIIRKGLFEKLETAVEMSVVFIQGGAGTGKTTLVATYILEKQWQNVSWLSLDGTITNVYSFWHYFSAALSSFLKEGEQWIGFIENNPEARNIDNLVVMLVNQIKSEQDYYIVLDDIHCLLDQDLWRSVERFLSFMPDNLHIIMLSREEPPVYLGPLVMAGRLLYIDSSQMYLSAEEGLEFLEGTLQVSGTAEEKQQLNQYAEGWIGGLQLVVAAKSMGQYQSQLLRAGGGIAMEYLNRELMEHLEEKEKDFLVKTGAFSYFDYSICSEIFPEMTRRDFQQTMEELVGRNLFIITLDEENEIYRYHNIFSEYLKQIFEKLPIESKKKLRNQVAKCLEQQDNLEEALQVYLENEEYERIMEIAGGIENGFEAVPYLEKIPVDQLLENAELSALCFIFNIWKIDVSKSRELYMKFKERYAESDLFYMLQFAEVYLSTKERSLPQYHIFSAEKIEKLKLSKTVKAFLLVENSMALMEKMEYAEAENCIHLAQKISKDRNIYIDYFAQNQLAQIYEEVGRLEDSLRCYDKNRRLLETSAQVLGMETNHSFGLLGVHMRRMELVEAEEVLALCEKVVRERKIQSDVVHITLVYHQAEMLLLKGENEKGRDAVNHILLAYEGYNILTLIRLLYELECVGLLEEHLMERVLLELNQEVNFAKQSFMKMFQARLLFRQGDCEKALMENDQVLKISRKNNNLLRLVEAGILKIYMLTHRKESGTSQREIMNLSFEVIHYAYQNKIRLPFYLDRQLMHPIFLEILKEYSKDPKLLNREELEFVYEVLELCGDKKALQKNLWGLSMREKEVLEQLALGITNKEIAESLFISIATVKTHILSIFNKMEVYSRMMAVEKARKAGMILS